VSAEAPSPIGIIGGGAWGTALGLVCLRAGSPALLWVREPELVPAINERHENPLYLPGIALDPRLRATLSLAEAAACDSLLLVVPAQHLAGVARGLAPHLAHDAVLVSCAKGIEIGSGRLMTEIIQEALPQHRIAVLSGPTFAREVAENLPTAVTLASSDLGIAEALCRRLGSRHFRPYAADDPLGAEIGGAVKNVLAIACGIAMGRGLGDNARAALITRGLAEIMRFGLKLGARRDTMIGLSGLGDLTLTCSAEQSRNFSLGMALGRGERLDRILADRISIAEGVYSAAALMTRARQLGLDLPIAQAVDAVLNRGAAIDATIAALLARPFRAESEDAIVPA
jgi:glycerol-3-phosphate dehydrogenase (NAD(P)+)